MSQAQINRADAAVKAAYVASLFDNPKSLIVGAAIQIAAVAMSYGETHHPAYLALCALIGICALWRFRGTMSFASSRPDLTDPKQAKAWEDYQLVAVCISCLLVGTYGFLGNYLAPDEFTELASAIVTMGTTVSIIAKYYGSIRLTRYAILSTAAPFLLGLLLTGDPMHVTLAILFLPFMVMTMTLAGTLRDTLFTSARGRVLIAEIADRFDTALNNMPQGLLMIGSDKRIEVANKGIGKILKLNGRAALEGRSLDMLFAVARRQGLFKSRAAAQKAANETMLVIDGTRKGDLRIALADGRHLQVTGQERAHGGAVLVIEDVTERVATEAKIGRMARFDHLTGLPNRGHFAELAKAAIKRSASAGTPVALYVMDVDAFKSINDSYGHQVGDLLLQKIGKKLDKLHGGNVIVSRLGGDEFTVLLTRVAQASDADAYAQHLIAQLASVYDLDGVRHQASISIGYVYSEAGGEDLQDLMVRADIALYVRKYDRSQPYVAYHSDMEIKQRERMKLKADLGAAIRDGGLRVVYQPVIDVQAQRLIACEALVRWTHPVLGPISPAIFVPLAEDMGIVSDITAYVLNEACVACAAWPDPVSISVNLSAIDFDNDQLVDRVRTALQRSSLPAYRLELEITETAAVKSPDKVSEILGQLRVLGCKIALDDFGVGYSGLSHLHSLPLDRVKVDRSFTLSIQGDDRKFRLLSAILSLANALDLSTTVEGIEDYQTLERVISAGPVRRIQGFVFGGHLSAQQILDLADRHYPMKSVDAPVKLTSNASH